MCDNAVPTCCVNVRQCCAHLLCKCETLLCPPAELAATPIHLFGLQRAPVQLTARHHSGLPDESLSADQVTAPKQPAKRITQRMDKLKPDAADGDFATESVVRDDD